MGLPFVLLLGKAGKRRLAVLALAAFSALVGHWLDLYVMIFPDVCKDRVWPGLLETGMALGLGAACVGSAVPRTVYDRKPIVVLRPRHRGKAVNA